MKPHLFALVYLLLFSITFSSCSRPSDDMARVSISLPETYYVNRSQQNSSSYVSNILRIANNVSTQSNASTDPVANQSDWAPIVPTGYQVGRYDTNCLLVVATGPQLDSHACYKMNGQAAVNAFYFGEMSEPTGVGSEKANLEVLVGTNRVFILLGMHAVSYSDCKKMTDPTFDKSKLSKPYIIGKSESVSVESGRLNTFSIAVKSVDPDSYIDYCEATGNIEQPPVTRTIGNFELNIDNPITSNVAHHDQCVPVSIKLKDSTRLYDLQSTYINQFSLVTSSGNSPQMYKTGTGCLTNDTNDVLASFSTQNLYETRVWIRAQSSDNTKTLTLSGTVSGTVTVSNGTTTSSVSVRSTPILSFTTNAAVKAPMLVVPDKILNNVCYPATFTTGFPSFSQGVSINSNVVTNLEANVLSPRAGAQVLMYDFADYNCAGAGTVSSTSSAVVANTLRTRYFKVTGFEPGDVINFSHYSSENSYKVYRQMVVQQQDTVVERLAIDGPRDLLDPARDLSVPANSTNCYGPYRIYVVNKKGAAVPPVNPTTLQRVDVPILISFDENAGTKLYRRATDPASPACDASHSISATVSENIDGQLGYFEFYVKIISYSESAASLNRYIRVLDKSVSNTKLPDATLQLKIHSLTVLPEGEDVPPPPYCSGERLGPNSWECQVQ